MDSNEDDRMLQLLDTLGLTPNSKYAPSSSFLLDTETAYDQCNDFEREGDHLLTTNHHNPHMMCKSDASLVDPYNILKQDSFANNNPSVIIKVEPTRQKKNDPHSHREADAAMLIDHEHIFMLIRHQKNIAFKNFIIDYQTHTGRLPFCNRGFFYPEQHIKKISNITTHISHIVNCMLNIVDNLTSIESQIQSQGRIPPDTLQKLTQVYQQQISNSLINNCHTLVQDATQAAITPTEHNQNAISSLSLVECALNVSNYTAFYLILTHIQNHYNNVISTSLLFDIILQRDYALYFDLIQSGPNLKNGFYHGNNLELKKNTPIIDENGTVHSFTFPTLYTDLPLARPCPEFSIITPDDNKNQEQPQHPAPLPDTIYSLLFSQLPISAQPTPSGNIVTYKDNDPRISSIIMDIAFFYILGCSCDNIIQYFSLPLAMNLNTTTRYHNTPYVRPQTDNPTDDNSKALAPIASVTTPAISALPTAMSHLTPRSNYQPYIDPPQTSQVLNTNTPKSSVNYAQTVYHDDDYAPITPTPLLPLVSHVIVPKYPQYVDISPILQFSAKPTINRYREEDEDDDDDDESDENNCEQSSDQHHDERSGDESNYEPDADPGLAHVDTGHVLNTTNHNDITNNLSICGSLKLDNASLHDDDYQNTSNNNATTCSNAAQSITGTAETSVDATRAVKVTKSILKPRKFTYSYSKSLYNGSYNSDNSRKSSSIDDRDHLPPDISEDDPTGQYHPHNSQLRTVNNTQPHRVLTANQSPSAIHHGRLETSNSQSNFAWQNQFDAIHPMMPSSFTNQLKPVKSKRFLPLIQYFGPPVSMIDQSPSPYFVEYSYTTILENGDDPNVPGKTVIQATARYFWVIELLKQHPEVISFVIDSIIKHNEKNPTQTIKLPTFDHFFMLVINSCTINFLPKVMYFIFLFYFPLLGLTVLRQPIKHESLYHSSDLTPTQQPFNFLIQRASPTTHKFLTLYINTLQFIFHHHVIDPLDTSKTTSTSLFFPQLCEQLAMVYLESMKQMFCSLDPALKACMMLYCNPQHTIQLHDGGDTVPTVARLMQSPQVLAMIQQYADNPKLPIPQQPSQSFIAKPSHTACYSPKLFRTILLYDGSTRDFATMFFVWYFNHTFPGLSDAIFSRYPNDTYDPTPLSLPHQVIMSQSTPNPNSFPIALFQFIKTVSEQIKSLKTSTSLETSRQCLFSILLNPCYYQVYYAYLRHLLLDLLIAPKPVGLYLLTQSLFTTLNPPQRLHKAPQDPPLEAYNTLPLLLPLHEVSQNIIAQALTEPLGVFQSIIYPQALNKGMSRVVSMRSQFCELQSLPLHMLQQSSNAINCATCHVFDQIYATISQTAHDPLNWQQVVYRAKDFIYKLFVNSPTTQDIYYKYDRSREIFSTSEPQTTSKNNIFSQYDNLHIFSTTPPLTIYTPTTLSVPSYFLTTEFIKNGTLSEYEINQIFYYRSKRLAWLEHVIYGVDNLKMYYPEVPRHILNPHHHSRSSHVDNGPQRQAVLRNRDLLLRIYLEMSLPYHPVVMFHLICVASNLKFTSYRCEMLFDATRQEIPLPGAPRDLCTLLLSDVREIYPSFSQSPPLPPHLRLNFLVPNQSTIIKVLLSPHFFKCFSLEEYLLIIKIYNIPINFLITALFEVYFPTSILPPPLPSTKNQIPITPPHQQNTHIQLPPSSFPSSESSVMSDAYGDAMTSSVSFSVPHHSLLKRSTSTTRKRKHPTPLSTPKSTTPVTISLTPAQQQLHDLPPIGDRNTLLHHTIFNDHHSPKDLSLGNPFVPRQSLNLARRATVHYMKPPLTALRDESSSNDDINSHDNIEYSYEDDDSLDSISPTHLSQDNNTAHHNDDIDHDNSIMSRTHDKFSVHDKFSHFGGRSFTTVSNSNRNNAHARIDDSSSSHSRSVIKTVSVKTTPCKRQSFAERPSFSSVVPSSASSTPSATTATSSSSSSPHSTSRMSLAGTTMTSTSTRRTTFKPIHNDVLVDYSIATSLSSKTSTNALLSTKICTIMLMALYYIELHYNTPTHQDSPTFFSIYAEIFLDVWNEIIISFPYTPSKRLNIGDYLKSILVQSSTSCQYSLKLNPTFDRQDPHHEMHSDPFFTPMAANTPSLQSYFENVHHFFACSTRL